MRKRLGSRGVCSSGLQVFGVLRGEDFTFWGFRVNCLGSSHDFAL